jgi:hypothetical protein
LKQCENLKELPQSIGNISSLSILNFIGLNLVRVH